MKCWNNKIDAIVINVSIRRSSIVLYCLCCADELFSCIHIQNNAYI